MKIVRFKDQLEAEKYGCADQIGEVKAEETRDGGIFLVVAFPCVEINGVPKSLFDMEDLGD